MLPQVTIDGRMVADPELRFAPSGVAVGKFRVVASSRKQVDGEWVDDKTLWMQVTCFKKLAENVVDSLVKGDLVVVTGRISTDEWTTDAGEKRSSVVMIADSVAPSLAFRTIPHSAGRAERSSGGEADPWASPAAEGGATQTQQESEPPF